MTRNVKLILASGAAALLLLLFSLSALRRAEEAREDAVSWRTVERIDSSSGYARARAFIDGRLADHPQDALLYYYRARLAYEHAEPEPALADADRAIELGYAQEISHLLKALVYGRLRGEWARQAELASKAAALDPTYGEAYLVRAEALYATGDHSGCARDAGSYSRMEPAAPEGWEYLLLCREALGDVDGAEAAGRKVLELRPSSHAAHWRLGRLHAARGLHKRAIRRFAEAINLSGGRPAYYLDRAASCAAEGDFSCEAWDRASAAQWEEVSSCATHYLLLGGAMYRAGERGQALEAAGKALELDPLLPGAWRLSARLRAENGDAAGARAALRKMAALDPALGAEAARLEAGLAGSRAAK